MRVERDPETGAAYYYVTDAPVARTVSITDLVMVDVDSEGNPVGVELLSEFVPLSDAEALYAAFPSLTLSDATPITFADMSNVIIRDNTFAPATS